ncbi:hypothetical protein OBBRIDRAFT_889488 [Obba rivulosa]|uniref:Uncharacterized protein n=1 Tax=Obba rivulosa TaxID=1052685 RepID=A0A8E2DJH5_9APHY|nr:hypothetical protein OBBRIDRAFT_889488 [Obba rivulosa]
MASNSSSSSYRRWWTVLLVSLKTSPFIGRFDAHSVAQNFLFRAWMLRVVLPQNEFASLAAVAIQASERLTALSLVPVIQACDTMRGTASRRRLTVLPRPGPDSSAIAAAGSPDFSKDLSISSNTGAKSLNDLQQTPTSVEYFEPTKTLRLPYKFDDTDPTIPTAHPASRLLSAAKSQYGLSYFATYSVDCPASLRFQRTSSASIPISSALPTARRSVYSWKIASTPPSLCFFWWTLVTSLSLILVLPSAVLLNNWLKKTDISNLDPQETFGYIPTSPVELTFILPEDSMTFLELALEILNSSNVRVKFVHLASATPTLVNQPLPCMTFSPRQDIFH